MPTDANKPEEYYLLDKENKRYRAKRGWTTQIAYAKKYIKEDATEQQESALSSGGVILTLIPVEE